MKFPNRASKLFSKFAIFRDRAPLSIEAASFVRAQRVDGAAREKREADPPTDVRRA